MDILYGDIKAAENVFSPRERERKVKIKRSERKRRIRCGKEGREK